MSDTIDDIKFDDYLSNGITYLLKILENGEGSKVEVKLSMDGPKDNVAKATCALANQRGGKVVIGLAEAKFYRPEMGEYSSDDVIGQDFIVFGVKNPDKARIELSSHLRANTNLGTNLEDLYTVKEVGINNKKVVILNVKPFFTITKRLVLYKNEIYRRIDNQSVKLTMADIANIINGDSISVNSEVVNAKNIMEVVEENKDAVYVALRVVIESNKASTSLLQRRLRIGYGKSARLIDRLEKAGIIGPFTDSKIREVLIKDPEQAKQLLKDMDL